MEENRKKLLKNAAKELYHWSKLRHPNTLPLMGLALFRGYISMISEWMDHGSLTDYLRKYPDVDRIALCVGICDGLCYIHEGDMVHGDLKGAPELFSERENMMSKSSDVYAYGMETLTGTLPFEGKSERSLLASLATGNLHPTRPASGIGDELWELTSCWARHPADRPPITTVRDRLRPVRTPSKDTQPEYDESNDPNARYIFNGFPTWLNWDLFTRFENAEREDRHRGSLPRVTSTTALEQLQNVYSEWRDTRDKWVDRFWDPDWARFMHVQGGPIQRELAAERQTRMGQALEAARVYQREQSELPMAKFEFSRGYLWDQGYMHPDWRWIKQRPWPWTVEHENDERRASGRAPLPRYYPGMSADDWREVRDVWHTTGNKWGKKRKEPGWLERDRQEGITPEQRHQLEQQFLKSRKQHKSIHKTSVQWLREDLSPNNTRHDSAIEVLQEAFKQAQLGTPQISEAKATNYKRRIAQQALDDLMHTPAPSHARRASSINYADQYESFTSDERVNPYPRPANGFPPPPGPDPLPDWTPHDSLGSSMNSMPGQTPSVPPIGKPTKTGILKRISKRALSMQRQENDSAHPVTIQPIRFDRSHSFSMTSPHALEFEGRLYPSAIHLCRPARRGRSRNTEESWHPELAEAIRQTAEPGPMADQWATAGGIGKDGTIMRSLQCPDWGRCRWKSLTTSWL
ncbi:unnamed protein product [Rhizoctonia solani]|uniref:Protein kinase domain-containing protein n=1 Tax=Rhizoctonia solani TaxID=456999 RepID=A0A8H3DMH1_9AGAM|nr:unnamed protein product [Rhizoctonia solani]